MELDLIKIIAIVLGTALGFWLAWWNFKRNANRILASHRKKMDLEIKNALEHFKKTFPSNPMNHQIYVKRRKADHYTREV